MTEKSLFTNLSHIGMVVKDIEKAAKYLSPLCQGPFEPLSMDRPVKELLVRGKPVELKMNLAMAQLGPIRIELIQPIAGESPHKDFLDSKGEGINHIAYAVDNLDSAVAKLTRQGYKVTMSVKWADGKGGLAFLEAEGGGITVELMQG